MISKMLIIFFMTIIFSLNICKSQIIVMKEIDTIGLFNLKPQSTIKNGNFYFIQQDYQKFYIFSNQDIINKHEIDDIFPNKSYREITNSPGILPFTEIIVSNNVVTLGCPNIGIIQYDGIVWSKFNSFSSTMERTGVFGMATNGEGEYIFLNKEGPNKIGFLKDGEVEIRVLEIVGEQVEYFYPNRPLVFFEGNYYLNASLKQMCKVDGDKLITYPPMVSKYDSDVTIATHDWKVHDGYIWLVTGAMKNEEEAEVNITRFDGENFEYLDFFFDRLEEEEPHGAFHSFEFDREGNIWIIMSKKREGYYDYTLLIYNENFELIYDRDLDEYSDIFPVQKIAIDPCPGGIKETYIICKNGLLTVDPVVTSVEAIEARATLHFSKISPNPVNTMAKVDFLATHSSIKSLKFVLTDYLGRIVELKQPQVNYDRTTGQATAKIDMSHVGRGYYYLLIQSDEYTVYKSVIIN
jgi:hypothetical protein